MAARKLNPEEISPITGESAEECLENIEKDIYTAIDRNGHKTIDSPHIVSRGESIQSAFETIEATRKGATKWKNRIKGMTENASSFSNGLKALSSLIKLLEKIPFIAGFINTFVNVTAGFGSEVAPDDSQTQVLKDLLSLEVEKGSATGIKSADGIKSLKKGPAATKFVATPTTREAPYWQTAMLATELGEAGQGHHI